MDKRDLKSHLPSLLSHPKAKEIEESLETVDSNWSPFLRLGLKGPAPEQDNGWWVPPAEAHHLFVEKGMRE